MGFFPTSIAIAMPITIMIAIGIFLPMGPLAYHFKLQALPLNYFPLLLAMVFGYMALVQWVKRIYIRRYGWQ